MKGIVLAGGSGSRLYPLTNIVCKQLLPVYDKPMISYPMSILMLMNIKDILIISTPEDTPRIESFFGDGRQLGLNLSYKVQEKPNGIAQAFVLGEEFIGDDSVALILGDNIFYLGNQIDVMRKEANELKDGAMIFGYHVVDPQRFGVIEYDKEFNVISIEEKPAVPKSNYAAVGLYFYDNNVVKYAKGLKPSKRGEYEITDLNVEYLKSGKLKAMPLKRGTAWLDAGTPESLLQSSNFIGMVEQRQGLKIACLEEIAYRRKFINKEQMLEIINSIKDGVDYKKYLMRVVEE